MLEIWGALFIVLACPILGGLPLIDGLFWLAKGRKLSQLGTGNVGVSAAFYHGGIVLGCLAVLSEAGKGILAVWVTRQCFPTDAAWELVALMALVMGRYWMGKGAGTTNVVWGYVLHDPVVAGLTFVIGGIGFTIFRERQQGRVGVLILFPLLTFLLHPLEPARAIAAMLLGSLIGWIYTKLPDDLDLPSDTAQGDSRQMFQFFRGDRAILTLDHDLKASKVGEKAATLSQLKRWGYAVPQGWILLPGDDPEPLLTGLQPTPDRPLVVRSSAIGEDSEVASAAGQYDSILDITHSAALQQAIAQCLASYIQPGAIQYRRDRGLPDTGMAVLIQEQIHGAFSGVAFSRDPIMRHGDMVIIEALPGPASRVVSGKFTPEQYRIAVADSPHTTEACAPSSGDPRPDSLLPPTHDVPANLILQVAQLARDLETRYHGIPQDIEWTYDGQQLWVLQSRPITTLLPIWTRKIAAEVIPGFIRPLTWSINRPLTCGVWGEIFTIVLGGRSRGLDFNATATLHGSRAYFNATLLGQIFQRMGLPTESLEFLTRGAKFSKPPLQSTLQNTPGLLRLWARERRLEQDFRHLYRQELAPLFQHLVQTDLTDPDITINPPAILERIDQILHALKSVTYFSILAPLSVALSQALSPKLVASVDNGKTPEIAALRSLQHLAEQTRALLNATPSHLTPSSLFTSLAQTPEGRAIIGQFEQFLAEYGYLSEVGTDIAVPTWKEDPAHVQQLWVQLLLSPPTEPPTRKTARPRHRLQKRVDLKGEVTQVYSQLLAHLRWSVVALERQWLVRGWIAEPGDIFFLELDEIRQVMRHGQQSLNRTLMQLVTERRSRWQQDHQLEPAPMLVYGNPIGGLVAIPPVVTGHTQLRGIGASPGQVEGRVRLMPRLQPIADIDDSTILVVPYTDSGWAPLLARAGGLIAEVGGQLSHGAIVAREYGIPAVMDVHHALQLLQDGQRVRIDGQLGIVEIL